MEYVWYLIFNTDEFDELDLVSKEYILNLEDIGQSTILVTKGVEYGITYDDVFLSLNLNEKNPQEFDSHAIYIDENNDVFLGVPVED